MKNQIGFIAIGQAGGNIGKLLEKLGYNILFINSSKEDLDTIEAKNKYHIANAEGCSKNRLTSKKIIQNDFKNLMKEINTKVPQDIIYIIGSTGGGTGSGGMPILADILLKTNPNKSVGLVTILPSESEPLKAHINAYETFQEINNIDNLSSVFVIDNNKHQDRLHLNNLFVKWLDKLLNVTDYKSELGNIDKAEIKEFIKSKGCIIMNCVQAKNNKIELIESLKKSRLFADLENDKTIKYLLVSSPKRIELDGFVNELGTYLDVFSNKNTSDTLIAISGASLPFTRLKETKEFVERNKDSINLFNSNTNNVLEDLNIDLSFNDNKDADKNSNDNKVETTIEDIADNIFASYMK